MDSRPILGSLSLSRLDLKVLEPTGLEENNRDLELMSQMDSEYTGELAQKC